VVYVEDDHTVARTTTNFVKAGRFMGFGGDPDGSDATKCWIEISPLSSLGWTAVATADGSDAATTQALANRAQSLAQQVDRLTPMLVNAANVAEIFRNFRVIFMDAYHGATQPEWEMLAMRVESSGAEESYDWLGAIPTMRELIGEVQINNLAANNWRIVNREFENTIGVKRKDIERDKLGLYRPLLQLMGADARKFPDYMVAKLLADGFSTKDYTGKNFFDANKEGTPGTDFPFTNFTNKKLSADNFTAGRQNLLERRAANGRNMGLGMDLMPRGESEERDTRETNFAGGLHDGGRAQCRRH
jgi:hypothetical protein